MIQIDIEKPKTCAECLMACRDSFYEIYCRKDMKKHEPFDKGCSLKEVPTGKWIPIDYDGYADGNPVYDVWECSNCGYEHNGDNDTLTAYCPDCGCNMVDLG